MPKISIFSHLLWNGKNGGCFWCCFLPIWRIMMDHGWMGFLFQECVESSLTMKIGKPMIRIVFAMNSFRQSKVELRKLKR